MDNICVIGLFLYLTHLKRILKESVTDRQPKDCLQLRILCLKLIDRINFSPTPHRSPWLP